MAPWSGERESAMAGKVSDVKSVTDGYGFTLHDDVWGGSPCLTLTFETIEAAAVARQQAADAFAKAKSATAPPSR